MKADENKNMELELTNEFNISEAFKEYGSRLAAFIRKRVARLEDAEDILQEVFSQLADADRLMKPIDEMTAWLYTVARNRITDLYRKKKPVLYDEFYSDDEFETINEELGRIIDYSSENPEDDYMRALALEEISRALAEMPEKQREAFEMAEFEGLSFKEMAEITGEPVNTLISRKRYAVLFLRERLEYLYEEIINY